MFSITYLSCRLIQRLNCSVLEHNTNLKIRDLLFKKNHLWLKSLFSISTVYTSQNIWKNDLSKLHPHPTVDKGENIRWLQLIMVFSLVIFHRSYLLHIAWYCKSLYLEYSKHNDEQHTQMAAQSDSVKWRYGCQSVCLQCVFSQRPT